MEPVSCTESLSGSIPVAPDAPMPLEYRYGTGIAGLLAGGLALILLAGFFLEGTARLLVLLPAALSVVLGLSGFVVDPSGCIGSLGRRIVVTDATLEEIDEKGRIRWCFAPGDVLGINVERRHTFFPWRRPGGRRVEIWHVELRNSRAVRIPVWLLPDMGGAFKRRFDSFLKRAGIRYYWRGDAA